MFGRRSGDGFLRCSDGHVRWGVFGAAGVVFLWRGPDGDRVMLQKRSMMAHEGGTWSCAGGAIDDGETPEEAALREAMEEVGHPDGELRFVGEYVFAPATDWSYTTVVIEVDQQFGDSLTTVVFAAAWPHLAAIVAGAGSATGAGAGEEP